MKRKTWSSLGILPVILVLLLGARSALAQGTMTDLGTLNSNNMVITALSDGDDFGLAVALQEDGKVLVAGGVDNGSSDMYRSHDYAIVRYNTDLSLDTGFGTDGIVTTDIDLGLRWGIADIVVQNDDKILVTASLLNQINPHIHVFSMIRYNSNGSLDTAFGNNGFVTTSFSNWTDSSYSIIIQDDSKIILAGDCDFKIPTDFCMARYNSNGSLDTSFGSGGRVRTSVGNGYDFTRAALLQPDGKIIMAGSIELVAWSGQFDFGMIRYNSDGSLDTTFGSNGFVITDFGMNYEFGTAAVLQSDGKIVLTGGIGYRTQGKQDIGMVRYNSDGSLNTSFGTGGKVMTDINGMNDNVYGIVLQPGGKLVLTGSTYNGDDEDFFLVRYHDNGTIDETFGADGITTTDFAGGNDIGTDVILSGDGTFYVSGYAHALGKPDYGFALAHYRNNGVLFTNDPPEVDAGGPYLVSVGATIALTGSGTDPNQDPLDYTWEVQSGSLSDPSSLTPEYTAGFEPGVFDLTLTGTDPYGLFDTDTTMMVIYDPEGGFVTGGGWIDSPEGACQLTEACVGATGKATFGFVSKYKKGANTPTGVTEFQFKAGNLNFHSNSYEWLVVANHKAQYKGVGTINGGGNYGFMLFAIDANLTPSTDVDLFRIKIWDKDNGDAEVYDNGLGADDGDENATTEIGGGSIVIHTSKKK